MLLAVAEENGEGQNDKTGDHHVVQGLEVLDSEHEGQQRLPELEDFLGTLLEGVVLFQIRILLFLVPLFCYFGSELL